MAELKNWHLEKEKCDRLVKTNRPPVKILTDPVLTTTIYAKSFKTKEKIQKSIVTKCTMLQLSLRGGTLFAQITDYRFQRTIK